MARHAGVKLGEASLSALAGSGGQERAGLSQSGRDFSSSFSNPLHMELLPRVIPLSFWLPCPL